MFGMTENRCLRNFTGWRKILWCLLCFKIIVMEFLLVKFPFDNSFTVPISSPSKSPPTSPC